MVGRLADQRQALDGGGRAAHPPAAGRLVGAWPRRALSRRSGGGGRGGRLRLQEAQDRLRLGVVRRVAAPRKEALARFQSTFVVVQDLARVQQIQRVGRGGRHVVRRPLEEGRGDLDVAMVLADRGQERDRGRRRVARVRELFF